MMVCGFDPGPLMSGYALWDGARVIVAGTDVLNDHLLRRVLPIVLAQPRDERGITLAIERVACYGAPVGDTVLETVFFSGRVAEWWRLTTGQEAIRLRFGDVALHHCQSRRAKESQVRQALIDRFGGKGTRTTKGPFYGVSGHAWSAVAVAVAAWDQWRTDDHAGRAA